MSKAWKDAEREVAEFFGLKRRVRISYSESVGDTTPHELYSIECKYGKQIPKYCIVDVPTTLLLDDHGRGFVMTPSTWWLKRKTLCYARLKRKEARFLEDCMEQALGYNSAKTPLVCVKPYRYQGFVIINRLEHTWRHSNSKSGTP